MRTNFTQFFQSLLERNDHCMCTYVCLFVSNPLKPRGLEKKILRRFICKCMCAYICDIYMKFVFTGIMDALK